MASNLKRAERERRVEADTGAPSDTVYRLGSRVNSGIYHEREDCQFIESTRRVKEGREAELTAYRREEAQRSWDAPCKRCVLKEAGHDA